MFDSGIPYNPFRSELYTVAELMQGYDGKHPKTALDAIIADYYVKHGGIGPDANVALGERIHDHAIDVALSKIVKDRKVVGVMGGHSNLRNEPIYTEVARLGKLLTSAGYVVVTGGGPGIMEAANLGAYMALYGDGDLKQAIDVLAKAPSYKKTPVEYIQAAQNVTKTFPPKGSLSLAVPTWAYSDEPTGQFSSHIAKYFANSIREDGLLAIGTYGIIFAPGKAGTLQEIFQATAHNSYFSFDYRAAMLFLGKADYTQPPSIFDLVKDRAQKDGFADFVGICDSAEEAVKFIQDHPPEAAPKAQLQFGRWSSHFQSMVRK